MVVTRVKVRRGTTHITKAIEEVRGCRPAGPLACRRISPTVKQDRRAASTGARTGPCPSQAVVHDERVRWGLLTQGRASSANRLCCRNACYACNCECFVPTHKISARGGDTVSCPICQDTTQRWQDRHPSAENTCTTRNFLGDKH